MLILLTSIMISSVIFSGSPPTNTVRQPGGLSLVVGAGALGFGGNKVHDLQCIISLTGC